MSRYGETLTAGNARTTNYEGVGTMYERDYGPHYATTKELRPRDVAALIRKTVRQCAKDGLLPSEWTYSVRYESFSGGCAINVYVAIPDTLQALRDRFESDRKYRYTTFPSEWTGEFAPLSDLHAAETLLNQIHGGYNYDGSESQVDYFDVRYYGTVRTMSATEFGSYYGKVKA